MERGKKLAAESNGEIRICLSSADIKKAMADKVLAIMFHIEGAEAMMLTSRLLRFARCRLAFDWSCLEPQ